MIVRYPIESREQWLGLRKLDVTASDIAALFNAHPYKSVRALYEEKIEPSDLGDGIDTDVLRRGRLLEDAVAKALGEAHPDWKITKATDYIRDPDKRIGATLDFLVECPKRGRGIMQAKTVAPNVFRDSWTEDTPPLHVTLQAATEMMLEDVGFGIVAALVVDPYKLPLHEYEIPRHKATEKKLIDTVRQFWIAAEDGVAPPFDFTKDDDLITGMHPFEVEGKELDLSLNNRLAVVLARLDEIKPQADAFEKEEKALRAEIKDMIGDAEVAIAPDRRRITWKTRKAYVANVPASRVLRITKPPKKD